MRKRLAAVILLVSLLLPSMASCANTPVDENNHLMDALRYAFVDVKNFRPDKYEKLTKGVGLGITNNDLKGEWSN